ncbi:hypothetical protein [Azotobacter chroococcum]|uniref:hypothetical protein n=1 Tax=Azotobacter chroococcum TaxID=353 RepID=UPI0010AEB0C0|nr:hypothetical protein [Azotobacter chroococcum]TKD30793.1 hypothetical protein FCG41_24025 [Azotobacter chroococcum]
MKKFGILALTIGMLSVGTVNAAEIVREVTSETSGQAAGGMNGMMAGAVGGPIGAVLGAGFGALFGGSGQEALGASERIYLVRTDSGELKEYRSPNYVFADGEKVVIHGNRPRPYGWTPETADSFAYNSR